MVWVVELRPTTVSIGLGFPNLRAVPGSVTDQVQKVGLGPFQVQLLFLVGFSLLFLPMVPIRLEVNYMLG